MFRDSNKFHALDAVAVLEQAVLSVLFAAADELALMALTLARCPSNQNWQQLQT